MTAQVPDTWSTRDFPELVAIHEWFATHPERRDLRLHELMAVVDPDHGDEHGWGRALDQLDRAGYIEALRVGHPYPIAILRLTERGLRAIGAWPSDKDPVQVMVQVLVAEAGEVEAAEPERAGRLRLAADVLGGVAKEVGTELAVKFAARVAGLP